MLDGMQGMKMGVWVAHGEGMKFLVKSIKLGNFYLKVKKLSLKKENSKMLV